MAEYGDGGKALTRLIGGRLKSLREARGISRRQAAAAIGVSLQTYGNRENGATEIPAHEIITLADLLGVPPTALFDGLDAAVPVAAADPALSALANEAETFLRLLFRVPSPRLRQDLANAVKAIAKADQEDG